MFRSYIKQINDGVDLNVIKSNASFALEFGLISKIDFDIILAAIQEKK